jgi:predicted nucleic acid-binding protein
MVSLVDTSVLVDIERRGASWRADLARTADGEEVAVAAITVAELLVGFYRSNNDLRRTRRRAYVEDLYQSLNVVAFGVEEARTYARVWAELVSAGSLIGLHDIMIAATALTNNYKILTLNVRDFCRIPSLDVRQPEW